MNFSFNQNFSNIKTSELRNVSTQRLEGIPRLTSIAIKYANTFMEFKEAIVSVNQEKNILATPIQGRQGTVKEFISKGDYQISVELAVSNDYLSSNTNEYPIEKLNSLISLINIDETVELDSEFLDFFGIKSGVVVSYNLIQETHSNRQALQLEILSDEPYEIKLANNQNV